MNVPKEAFQRQFTALLPAYINMFILGCNIGWFSNAIYFFQDGSQVSATALQCAMMASIYEIGRIVFAIPTGILIDKFGTKKIIICAGTSHFICWLTMSLNSSIMTIYVVQFVNGATSSLVVIASLIYIGEVASPEIRGKLTGFYQIASAAGSISQSIITVTLSSYHMLSYIAAALSSLFFVSMYGIMETPNHLISKSNLVKAELNLKQLRHGYSENRISEEFEKLQEYIEDEKSRKKETQWLKFVFSKAIRKPLVLVLLLSFFARMNGIATISSYSTQIWPNVNLIPVRYYPLINQVLEIIVTICTTLYVDKYSRRWIIIIGSILIALLMICCTIVDYQLVKQIQQTNLKWILLTSHILARIVDGSVQAVRQTATSEILPQAIKGFGGSLSFIAIAISITITYFLYYVTSQNSVVYYLYAIFSINSLILCILVYFCMPEGRGMMLADLQIEFKKEVRSKEYLALAKHETI